MLQNFNQQESQSQTRYADSRSMSQSFMANVFSYMFAALGLSGLCAYAYGTSPELMSQVIDFEDGGFTIFGYVAMFAPLALVFFMAARFQKMSSMSLLITFLTYSVLTGISLSTIFLIYDPAVITKTFLVTSVTFGIMAFLGYTTKTDLTSMGKLLMMGLIGIIIAMVINWFMASPMLDYIITIVGVIVFTGLIAYDTQKLKRIGEGVEYGSQSAAKLAMMGALSLYLDFINLFLMLLRLFGGRD